MLSRLSIRQKLTAMLMLISGAVLALAAVAFVAWDFYRFRADMQADLVTQAQLVLENTAAAITFNDPEAAGETLEMLEIHPHTQLACLYLPNGAVVRVNASFRDPIDTCPAARGAGIRASPATADRHRATDAAAATPARMLLIAIDLDAHRARHPDAGGRRRRRSSSPACWSRSCCRQRAAAAWSRRPIARAGRHGARALPIAATTRSAPREPDP